MMNCRSGQDKATVDVWTGYPVLLSAVDPVAEDRLVGLGDAVTSGRMLTARDKPWVPSSRSVHGQRDSYIPALLSSNPLTAGMLSATVERLDIGDQDELPSQLGNPTAHSFVSGLHGTPVGQVRADLSQGYRKTLGEDSFNTDVYWTVGRDEQGADRATSLVAVSGLSEEQVVNGCVDGSGGYGCFDPGVAGGVLLHTGPLGEGGHGAAVRRPACGQQLSRRHQHLRVEGLVKLFQQVLEAALSDVSSSTRRRSVARGGTRVGVDGQNDLRHRREAGPRA
ncbi:hypothetical protein [Streptomyces griseoluteus]|uniref:hypothetical protein n=1 Tax=Streptomyces griseoluteus TaxID=29306 RepID=UPI0036F5BE48